MHWFFLLIPLLAVVVLRLYFKRETVLWEYLLPLAASTIVILIFQVVVQSSRTLDHEYWINHVKKVEYYEDWDEWIDETCTRSVPCGTDEDGYTQWCDETYDCSYVDYHDEEWVMTLDDNSKFYTNESKYKELKNRWGNEEFVDMNRDYHRIDGDMYYITWDNSFETLEDVTRKFSYKNKVQASTDVFNFQEVDTSKYKVYDYPKVVRGEQRVLLGIYNPTLDKYIRKKNSLIGASKQLKIFMIVYKNQPRNVAHQQKAYWKGGNKNEFVICVGVDDSSVVWNENFTWSEATMANVLIKDSLQNMDSLDYKAIVDHSVNVLTQHYKRKEFSDFDYLNISPTNNQLGFLFFLIFLVTFGCMVFIIKNDIIAF